MIDLIRVGNKIEQLRTSKNMTQGDLAEIMYVSHQAVSKWERGINLPSIETIVLLTQYFEISLDELVYDVEVSLDNVELLLRTHSRQYVISRILENEVSLLSEVFYLFKRSERMYILKKVVNSKNILLVKELWAFLCREERLYVLSDLDLVSLNNLKLVTTIGESTIIKRRRENNE